MRRRVVVTGSGWCRRWGRHRGDTGRASSPGDPGIGPITLFDAARHSTRFAGEVPGSTRSAGSTGRTSRSAPASSSSRSPPRRWRWRSGLRIDAANAARVGVVIGSGIGGFEVIEREHRTLLERGPDRVSPFFILSSIINLAAGQVSVRLGAKGPNSAVATACTTGAHAIGDAFRLIQGGYADAMICGGAEAAHHAARHRRVRGDARAVAAQRRSRRASRPWDVDPRRLRRRRRRRHPGPRGDRSGRRARRADPRRDRRLRHERRCPSPHRAARRRRRRRRG